MVVLLAAFAFCAATPQRAALHVIPPKPFVARVVSVRRMSKGLYRVTFDAVRGNAVLPSGHRYTQFAHVVRRGTRWCFVGGGSGP